ncbi:TPA: hypothetical protein DIU27_04040 [Candidatus Collierbacteria bacterium]|uniref:Uncharacterized protein n=1 Tax=Candidatus Collierbacteria bacterium GW2011_GWB2_44_22 TaxID=1618387 RepID=A0A0G1K4T4_9BACT|nr:MAG: hypothetical protein UW31_C0006G0006 [Candidatus Collierbacteria bacterium GW2011_GWA2_44_13]KKT48429.1 MAG: hypothetical protein UW42_C0058G0009 [Candidatus Collierbacteria bacterium GW2011_GWB1_44_197]KKT51287.1 MAG: hypothetical protein UW44_C0013G0007 [Candidatus Collierbacteria bacterium GW2011_GWB2_44_22]KKT61663.1 MAG: hypothetical protein UW56_C0022G0006 [Candidatus Collierbacteria bacterium GW2011_GWD1_44_27]KKT64975.1 MAG: hypothetical protein UW58_C0034G0008 [Candidatus Colli
MKALIIGQRVSANINDFIHGGGAYVKRMVLPDQGICVNIVEDQIYAFFGFVISEQEFDLFGQVEISQTTFDEILKVARLNDELNSARSELIKNVELTKILDRDGITKRGRIS